MGIFFLTVSSGHRKVEGSTYHLVCRIHRMAGVIFVGGNKNRYAMLIIEDKCVPDTIS